MAHALEDLFPASVQRALVAGPPAPQTMVLPPTWQVCDPAHPFPDEVSVRAGETALRFASDARNGWLVLLLSGGASSMLCAPADGISLADKVAASKALMNAGVPIHELNCVRKHLSAVKGGYLAAAAGRSLTLAISDVHHPVPDDRSVIGSGPTSGDPTTFRQALEIAIAVAGVPQSVIRRLEDGAAGRLPETVKPQDPRVRAAEFALLGNRQTALDGAAESAAASGFDVHAIDEPTRGDARDAARTFMARASQLARGARRPLCVLAAGETTVQVAGAGKGGRNQEFALSAAPYLQEFGTPAVLASVGTDGRDGPTDAAGAIVDSTTLTRAAGAGLDASGALARNDVYPFFAALGDLILSGPTGTNVGDVQVLLVG
jgi:glycerate 2-kinase